MPPTPLPRGPVRPSDVVNAAIRALLLRTGGWLYGDTRTEYEQLVAEWTVAVAAERVEVVEAA
ncbi:hypothetical protein ABT186_02315 [Streptomyces sp. NPDC001634]|uniref:hypothetical protein n=1 Tax=Streptomyces sp. NPDC001634 TaxID=3154390 RepID=UPI00331B5998